MAKKEMKRVTKTLKGHEDRKGRYVIRMTEQSCWNCGFKVLPGRYCLKCGKKNQTEVLILARRVDLIAGSRRDCVLLQNQFVSLETTIGIWDLVEWENGVGWAFGVWDGWDTIWELCMIC